MGGVAVDKENSHAERLPEFHSSVFYRPFSASFSRKPLWVPQWNCFSQQPSDLKNARSVFFNWKISSTTSFSAIYISFFKTYYSCIV